MRAEELAFDAKDISERGLTSAVFPENDQSKGLYFTHTPTRSTTIFNMIGGYVLFDIKWKKRETRLAKAHQVSERETNRTIYKKKVTAFCHD